MSYIAYSNVIRKIALLPLSYEKSTNTLQFRQVNLFIISSDIEGQEYIP